MAMSEKTEKVKKPRPPKKPPADAEKKPTGRPPIFKSVGELELKADEYFEWIKGEKKTDIDNVGDLFDIWIREPEPATITGLTLFLGFESRQSFYDYCEDGSFAYALKKYRTRIENEYEKKLDRAACTGAIFALKNMQWADNNKTELSGPGNTPLIPALNLNIVQPAKDEDADG